MRSAMTLPVLLQGVRWRFGGTPFVTQSDFETKLRAYQEIFSRPATWDADERVLNAPSVCVQYICWENDEQIEPIVTLHANDGASFSAGELLFKLHNAVVDKLAKMDRGYFEGLVHVREGVAGQPPLFRLRLGS